MTAAQTQLYFRTWQAAARAHGWTTKSGIVAALAGYHAGTVWESPELNQSLAPIYEIAGFNAQRDGRDLTADDLRHACTVAAIGRHASSKSFSNSDFDRVLARLRVLANPQSLKNLAAWQDGGEAGERRRHVHVITGAAAPYWKRIMADRFGHTDLDRLSLTELRQLSLTIRNRQHACKQPEAALQAA